MKELTIEQKAKAYDEAIEKFDVILNLNTVKESRTIFADDVRKIFPELEESEDEKIRKSIIGFLNTISSLKDGKTVSNEDFDSKTILEWVDWLEKQGEQNPNPYTGTSFEYNNHTWGMCARDGGVDILCDSKLIKHIEYPQGKTILENLSEQKQEWSGEDENECNHILKTLNLVAEEQEIKGYNNLISSVNWLKSLKNRIKLNKGESKSIERKGFTSIPFGAFDSELIEESITIPDGYYAVIEGRKVYIKKKIHY